MKVAERLRHVEFSVARFVGVMLVIGILATIASLVSIFINTANENRQLNIAQIRWSLCISKVPIEQRQAAYRVCAKAAHYPAYILRNVPEFRGPEEQTLKSPFLEIKPEGKKNVSHRTFPYATEPPTRRPQTPTPTKHPRTPRPTSTSAVPTPVCVPMASMICVPRPSL